MWGYTEDDEELAWWQIALIILVLPFLLVIAVVMEFGSALFSAAEWALEKRRVIWTAFVALIISLSSIWAISAANGM